MPSILKKLFGYLFRKTSSAPLDATMELEEELTKTNKRYALGFFIGLGCFGLFMILLSFTNPGPGHGRPDLFTFIPGLLLAAICVVIGCMIAMAASKKE